MKAAISTLVFMFLMFCLFGSANAAEYFVSIEGSDQHDGRGWDTAFVSVQQGVNALEPGDTLTIAPGEYHESVAREDLGSMEADIVIRAEVPGTALLRGDVPAPAFRKVEGYRFVYEADFDQEVQAVLELDTFRTLTVAPNVEELEFNPGRCHYDADAGKLYISPSDLQPPGTHRYSVAVIENRAGMFLHRATRVKIEGLAATGFHSHTPLPRMSGGLSSADRFPSGFYLPRARECELRNLTSFLNARGITVRSHSDRQVAGGNLVEHCVSYANNGHGIIVYNPANDEVRHSTSFFNRSTGIQFYASDGGRSRMFRNLSWGSRSSDVQIKAGGPHLAERIVGIGGWGQESRSDDVVHSLIGAIRNIPEQYRNNIGPDELARIDGNQEFADPAHHDYRLQATSRFRGAAGDGSDLGPFPYEENIYYVRPDGDDNADGLSVANAWRTLQRAAREVGAGDTLYLEGGEYEGNIALAPGNGEDHPLAIRSRGELSTLIRGDVSVENSQGVELERLAFAGALRLADSRDISVKNCRFEGQASGIRAERVSGLRVEHSEFAGGNGAGVEAVAGAAVFLRGNLFDNRAGPALRTDSADSILYSDYNAYYSASPVWIVGGADWSLERVRDGHDTHSQVLRRSAAAGDALRLELAAAGPLGRPAGVHVPEQTLSWTAAESFQLVGPFVHSVSDTTANLEWWTTGPTDWHVLRWGDTPEMDETAKVEAHRFGTFSLTGLKPGTKYYFRIDSISPAGGDEGGDDINMLDGAGELVSFTTSDAPANPVTYYVSMQGDDANTGRSAQNAWRTVTHAASRLRPGDTLLIGGGTYSESVRIRATGEEGRPITIKARPGEKVVFDGDDRALTTAFIVANKAHVHFDGMYFRMFGRGGPVPWGDRRGWNGVFALYRSDDVKITRCFHDGRGAGYSPGLFHAMYCKNLTVRNSVISASMGGGTSFAGCPGLRMENNVFLRNLIQNISEAMNEPQQNFYIANNIFTDNLPGKVQGPFFAIGKVESMVERDNWYYLRVPDEEKQMFQFYGTVAYERAATGYRVGAEFEEPPAIEDLTRMSLAGYQRRFAPNSGSRVGDPEFAGTRDVPRQTEEGEPIYRVDRLMGRRDLDFPHLFATKPEVVEAGIGLNPEAFEDFHFNQ